MHGVQISSGHEDNSVLIVNDAPEQLGLMRASSREGWLFGLYSGGRRPGVEPGEKNKPDLVISDVTMPHMNGLEFCKQLRSDTELKAVPILLVSALQKDTDSIVAGLRAGADDYLEVPFDSTRLVAKVARLLERSRLEANYRDLVERASDVDFYSDLSGRLISINSAGAGFLGRPVQEIVGQSFFSAFGVIPESNGFAGILGRATEAKVFRHQFIARSAKGDDRWLDLIVSPITGKHDETIGFRGVARDITERKNFEEALRDSETRYKLLFESTPNRSGFITKKLWPFLR
jgi:PAS domain S-box-containing protein